MRRLADFPLVPLSYLTAGLSMLGPAAVALAGSDHSTSQTFFYSGLLVIVFSVIAGFAARGFKPRPVPAGRMLELTVIFVTMPAILAIPVYLDVESASHADAYFEMVSCLTTTGASALPPPLPGDAPTAGWPGPQSSDVWGGGLPYAVVYWRAQVAWMGGLLIWLAAAEILSPLGVGGFEIVGRRKLSDNQISTASTRDSASRVQRAGMLRLALCYAGLTAILWLLMAAAGEMPVNALISAMSTLSTSGITAEGGFSAPSRGMAGEIIVFAFLLLALSRFPVSAVRWGAERTRAPFDREAGLALLLVLAAVGLALYFNHQPLAAARTWAEFASVAERLWGTVFSTVSFLTTAGFQSLHWHQATEFQPPGFVFLSLLGMALIGGGVATTAGGVKLIRIGELLRFSNGELGQLACPSAVRAEINPAGERGGRTVLACIFMMIFLILLAVFALLLSLSAGSFDQAIVLSISSLTNTGPLNDAVLGSGTIHSDLPAQGKLLLCAAMIIGRLELLALVTLFNPAVWVRSKEPAPVDIE